MCIIIDITAVYSIVVGPSSSNGSCYSISIVIVVVFIIGVVKW